jgi:signal transduction histidine kinase
LSARHLLQLIEEILSYARMEAGREQVRPERTTLRDLLDEVAALTEPLARERGLAFRVQHADGTELVTDVPKVRQILLNLLTNAVKFTEEGEVELGFEEDQDHVRLLVRDTGPGIDPENQERIFDPFWQVAHPQTRRTGGTGLGLSVARRLARLMGGDLDVRSAPGQGSTFIVELPRKVGLPPPPNG